MTRIEFTAYGEAKPAGSKRAFAFKRRDGSTGTSVVDACKKSAPWKHYVAAAAREAYDGPLLTGALTVSFHFYFPRPASHMGSGRNAGKIKASAPSFITKAPDVLKLSRGVEDAMQSVVYKNDSQIVQEHLFKSWGEPARVEIKIATLE